MGSLPPMTTPLFDQDRWIAAWRFAATAHLGQLFCGSDLPYIVHLGMVAMEVKAALAAEPQWDGDLAVLCALLHDTVEDTAVTEAELATHFGPDVAAGVLALTKNDALPEAEQMADSLRRIREQPQDVWIVKLADRITNLQPPPAHWSVPKVRRYWDEAIAIRDALGEASPFLLARMNTKLAAYEEFTR
jgi:(p)ppGpp synthase/HD superfamily hydrolase